MSLRKLAGLAAGFALTVGLIGTGVSAQWSKSVTAQENINVGSFGCAITGTTAGAITDNGTKLTYTVPDIIASKPDKAPFDFTVQNTGTILQELTVSSSMSGLPAEFSDLLQTNPVVLPGAGSWTFDAGLQWIDLSGVTAGVTGGSIKYTVSCDEYHGPTITYQSHGPNLSGAFWSQADLAGFPPTTNVSLAYHYGPETWWVGFGNGSNWQDILTNGGTYGVLPTGFDGSFGGANTADPVATSASFTFPAQENCQSPNTKTYYHTDLPVDFTAIWSGNTVTFAAAGTAVCSVL